MKPSPWKAPEPTTVSSAILFHCATVFPGGNAATASRVELAAPTAAGGAPTEAPERAGVDGPDRRRALARQSAGSPQEALVPHLEAPGDSPPRRGGGCRGRNAGDASDRLHASDRSRSAR